jgi:hypothetical protein
MLHMHVVYEDAVSLAIMERLIEIHSDRLAIGDHHHGRGFSRIKTNIAKYNAAAQHMPFFVLTDLDTKQCAPKLIAQWLPGKMAPLLFFRIAVKEVESWLIADREGLAAYLGISVANLSRDPDSLIDPKEEIFRLVRKSRSRSMKQDIIPEGKARIGPGYNDALPKFVRSTWNPEAARKFSPSLDKALHALAEYGL